MCDVHAQKLIDQESESREEILGETIHNIGGKLYLWQYIGHVRTTTLTFDNCGGSGVGHGEAYGNISTKVMERVTGYEERYTKIGKSVETKTPAACEIVEGVTFTPYEDRHELTIDLSKVEHEGEFKLVLPTPLTTEQAVTA